MTSPIEEFLRWYGSLPVSHRHDIAGIFGMCLFGYESIDISDDQDTAISKFIEITESSREAKYKELSTAISLRGFIQFFFIDKRSDRSGWLETKEILEELSDSHQSETFAKMSREVRFKEEQWVATCKKWDGLVSSHLSDQSLRDFIAIS